MPALRSFLPLLAFLDARLQSSVTAGPLKLIFQEGGPFPGTCLLGEILVQCCRSMLITGAGPCPLPKLQTLFVRRPLELLVGLQFRFLPTHPPSSKLI